MTGNLANSLKQIFLQQLVQVMSDNLILVLCAARGPIRLLVEVSKL